MGSAASVSAAIRASNETDLQAFCGGLSPEARQRLEAAAAACKDPAAAAVEEPPTTESTEPPTTDSVEKSAAPRPAANPMPAAPPAKPVPVSLMELVEKQHIVLIKFRYQDAQDGYQMKPDWLYQSIVERGEKLVRRQELPAEAVVDVDTAKAAVDEPTGAHVISHGWLGARHPDPENKRKPDFAAMYKALVVYCVFFDFTSLHQVKRSFQEERSFRIALCSMHRVYGHAKWSVVRFTTVPEGSPSSRPYLTRGWCLFESNVAAMAARMLRTIQDGKDDVSNPSPVPMTPTRFQAIINDPACHFTNGTVDADMVHSLYETIFPELKDHEKLIATAWTDQQVDQLLDTMADLPALKTVRIMNYMDGCTAKVSTEALDKLRTICEQRGGNVYYMPPEV